MIRNLKFTLIVITVISFNSYSQCINKKDPSINTQIKVDDNDLVIEFTNSYDKSIFLFSSYLNERYYNNKYLYCYNKSDSILRISYLPILMYVNTVESDVYKLVDEAILSPLQTSYNFIEILPENLIRITIDRNKLLEHLKQCEFYNYDNNSLKKQNLDKIIINNWYDFPIYLEFAFYNDISLLTTKGTEFDKRTKKLFVKRASDYKIKKILLTKDILGYSSKPNDVQ